MTTLRHHDLTASLRSGEVLLGLYHGYPAEGILETIGSGWDFIWIDGQHGQFSIDSALRAVRTTSSLGLHSVLRVPSSDAGLLGQYADTAAAALMIPQVDDAAAAEAVVTALRFPPRGKRSFGGRRVVDLQGRTYCEMQGPVIVAQIESAQGLENAEEIAAVDGVDVLFIGIDDLKLSLSIPIDTPLRESDALVEARRVVAAASLAAGKYCGLPVADPIDLRAAVTLGYQLISCGADVAFLRTGARRALEDSRKALDSFQNETALSDRANPSRAFVE
jgi:2-keto-3-deoxy-L-rhamnonate aldolase RhmA